MSLSTISTHFTEQTLDTIIREYGGLRHTAWHFGTGFKKGDSYLSEAFRLIIDGVRPDGETPLQVSVVVKAIPQSVVRRLTFRARDFFDSEISFYRNVLSEFFEFQAKQEVQAPIAFTEVPRFLVAHSDGINDFLVMEDLRETGYASAPRQSGMDWEHSKLVMRTLGKFHAISLAIHEQEPALFKRICENVKEQTYAAEHREWYLPVIQTQIAVARDAMRREYGGTEYEKKTLEFTDERYFERMCDLVQRRNRYSVIAQGDCWLPNFLLQYVNGKPQDAKMIDFQLARYCSPAIDISLCIYSCTQQDMRVEHYDDLLKIYHQSAAELLQALGSDPQQVYPYSAVLEEMRHAAQFGCGMSMEAIPMSVLPDEDTPDLDTLTGDEAVSMSDFLIYRPIENAEGRRRLADVFRHAIDQGYFD